MVKPYKGAREQSENFKRNTGTHSPPLGDPQLYSFWTSPSTGSTGLSLFKNSFLNCKLGVTELVFKLNYFTPKIAAMFKPPLPQTF